MVEMRIRGMTVDIARQIAIVWLSTTDEETTMPVAIYGSEALSVYATVVHEKPTPPPTHDLIVEILDRFHTRIDEVRIVSDVDVISTDIILMCGDEETILKVRPGDAIAMALRYEAPVLVSEDLLAEAGFTGFKKVIGPLLKEKSEVRIRPVTASTAVVELAIDELLAELDFNASDPDADRAVDPLTVLRRRLQLAVIREEYEEAGRLKKEIEQAQNGDVAMG